MLAEVFAEIVEGLPVGVVVLGPDGQVQYLNAAGQALVGDVPLHEHIECGSQAKEILISDDDGRLVALRLTARELTGRRRLVLVQDIAEIHELQQEILKMDRLASVGELTSGIAHEIRNPLAGIKTTAQVLSEELEPGDSRRDYVDRIVREIDRLNKLLLGFFDFAKPKSLRLAQGDLRQTVSDAVYLIKDQARKSGVELLEFYPRSRVTLGFDADMIKQVVMNIVMNGVQAMAEGGRLEVHLEESQQNVCIVVSDSGAGIPEHLRSKIFDPFFTTKPRGIGLGLSISYRLVKLHAGWIDFVTGPLGTTFKIFLPRTLKAGRQA